MLEAKEIIGLAVYLEGAKGRALGRPLGEVIDLCVDPVRGRVSALLIADGKLWRTKKLMAWSNVAAVEKSGVFVRTERLLPKGDQSILECWWLMGQEQGIFGRLIVDVRGEPLGRIGDLLIDPETGSVGGYRLSGGMLHDLVAGRQRIVAHSQLEREGERLQLQACRLPGKRHTLQGDAEAGRE